MNKRTELLLGIFFFMTAIAVAIHMLYLTNRINNEHMKLEDDIDCDKKLIAVLQVRNDARNLVDLTTRDAQVSLVAYFNDIMENSSLPPNDPHVVDVRNKYLKAAEARGNPNLFAPYPDCRS